MSLKPHYYTIIMLNSTSRCQYIYPIYENSAANFWFSVITVFETYQLSVQFSIQLAFNPPPLPPICCLFCIFYSQDGSVQIKKFPSLFINWLMFPAPLLVHLISLTCSKDKCQFERRSWQLPNVLLLQCWYKTKTEISWKDQIKYEWALSIT